MQEDTNVEDKIALDVAIKQQLDSFQKTKRSAAMHAAREKAMEGLKQKKARQSVSLKVREAPSRS